MGSIKSKPQDIGNKKYQHISRPESAKGTRYHELNQSLQTSTYDYELPAMVYPKKKDGPLTAKKVSKKS